MAQRIETRVSQAFWFRPQSASVEPAVIARMTPKDSQYPGVAWFDCLFEGGLQLPGQDGTPRRALTLLLTGPPGVGKSILSAEMCYRICHSRSAAQQHAGPPWSALYVTSEAHQPWMMAKVRSFGWVGTNDVFHADPERKDGVRIMSTPNLVDTADELERADPVSHDVFAGLLRQLSTYLNPGSRRQRESHDSVEVPDILVIDSLNSVQGTEEKEVLYRRFHETAAAGPRILIVVLDSAPTGEAADFWEFTSDVIVRLDRHYVSTHSDEHHESLGSSSYMIRTLEVVKARYQSHVWGAHQLKIYEPRDLKLLDMDDPGERSAHLARLAPWRSEGGIFVFPSIHWVLSLYKRAALADTDTVESGVPGLDTLLPKGYPKGRCTALLGSRGGHKSHLGYLEVIHRICSDDNSRGLVISLRDDEETTRKAMVNVLQQQSMRWDGDDEPARQLVGDEAEVRLRDFETAGRLEIAYFPPGYITPEEFFHRLLMSVHSLKYREDGKEPPHLTVLFNSLDQLSSRFPLCAREDIFVPGIVQVLSAEEVDSFFVAAQEPEQPPEYYGLESMAELILAFGRSSIKKKRYCNLVLEHCQKMEGGGASDVVVNRVRAQMASQRNAVVVEVVRYAGGEAAGARGMLELIGEHDPLLPLYGEKQGLHFVAM